MQRVMMLRFWAAVAAVLALTFAGLAESRQLLRGKPDDCSKIDLDIESKIACYGAASFEAREHESSAMLAKEKDQYGRRPSNLIVSHARNLLFHESAPEVIFVKSNAWGSAQIRADEAAWILSKFASTPATSLDCKAYRQSFCDSQPQNIKIVVHVKFVCGCDASFLGAVDAKHIYDPIDVFEDHGGFSVNLKARLIGFPSCAQGQGMNCFSAYLVANDKVRQHAQAADANAKLYVVQHHHNNFHNRQRAPFLSSGAVTVGIGGLEGEQLAEKLTEQFKRDFADAEVNITFQAVETMVSEGCPPDRMREPSPMADCYASKFESLALGIAWVQKNADGPEAAKALDDSAQRLVNMLAVGVPTIGHSVYASYREAVNHIELLRTADSVETLKERLLVLALDSEKFQTASEQALAVADLYSPAVIAKRYREVFSKV